MSLGMEVDFGPCHIMLDGDPAPLKRGSAATFRRMFIVAKRLDGLRCHLIRRYGSVQATLCYMGIQLLPIMDRAPSFRPISIVTKRSPILATAEHLFVKLSKHM